MGISIGGTVGVGKSTLAEKLHERFGGEYIKETVETNPFFKPFYEDKKRWAAQMQYFMLAERLKAYQQITNNPLSIYDQSLEFDKGVFAKQNWLDGNMTDDEYEVYVKLAEFWENSIVHRAPDLNIILQGSNETIKEHIIKRGRPEELGSVMDYFMNLNDSARDVSHEQLKKDKEHTLIINVDKIDFDNPVDFENVIDLVAMRLFNNNTITKEEYKKIISGGQIIGN